MLIWKRNTAATPVRKPRRFWTGLAKAGHLLGIYLHKMRSNVDVP